MPNLYSMGYLLVLWTIIYLGWWACDKLDESTERCRREIRARNAGKLGELGR